MRVAVKGGSISVIPGWIWVRVSGLGRIVGRTYVPRLWPLNGILMDL